MNADELDEGIRETVLWLQAGGFKTTDSGDGLKEGMDCAMPFPNVHMLGSTDPLTAVGEALLLRHRMQEGGAKLTTGQIQLTFDPVDGITTLSLYHQVLVNGVWEVRGMPTDEELEIE